MGKYYGGGLGQTSDNVLLSHGLLNSAANPHRFQLREFNLGFGDAAQDGTINMNVLRLTTANGTSTAMNPNPARTTDAAALATGGKTFTVNPTLSTILMVKSLNTRGTYRYFAPPGDEIECAAAQFASLGFQPISPTPTAKNLGLDYVIFE